ncbi:MAG: hypothetical protein LBR41_02010 [Rickettsiales bacterium]|jgi:hypothetical protein|nr:hypothetical protein [Rickettsiales bacterium]
MTANAKPIAKPPRDNAKWFIAGMVALGAVYLATIVGLGMAINNAKNNTKQAVENTRGGR